MIPTYQEKATLIIKESIKSAVFIDEKALEPYTDISAEEIKEEKLSITLFSNFRTNNISLAIHKFNTRDLEQGDIFHYLFDNRDLVLLDWKLDGEEGEHYSLQLLSKVVERGHIHFCCIYTSIDHIENVFDNILSFFSNETSEFYDELKLELSPFEEEVLSELSILKQINYQRNEKSSGILIGDLIKRNKVLVENMKKAVKTTDPKCAAIKTYIAFSNTQKSTTALPCPELISYDKNVVVIGNTIISILKKDYNNDPSELINRMASQVVESRNSFTQLLGIEMQNIFSRKGSFVDSNLLEVSKEAILHHRKQLREHDGIDIPFKDFIKEILAEHSKLSVRTEDLSLLEDGFLDSISQDLSLPAHEELVKMNIFYNSTKLKDNKSLGFGDVFKDSQNNYYLCITSVCDCLRPEKMSNSFYFVKGTKISTEKALKLGDTAFTSFISKSEIIGWTGVEAGVDEDLHKYKPVYIKPESYTVPKFKFERDERLIAFKLNEKGESINLELIYLTTIKQAYAQRIANHTFTYPVRVGIDFVTIR